MRHFSLAICLLVAVASIAGCGGSSASSSTSSDSSSDPSGSSSAPVDSTNSTQEGKSGGSLTKSEFIAQADDICAALQKKIAPLEANFQQLTETAKSASDFKKIAEVVRELVGYSANGIKQIQELEPPAADQGTITIYAGTVNSRVSTGKEFADALEAGEQAQVNSLSERGSDISEEVEQMAKSYGFKVCGSAK